MSTTEDDLAAEMTPDDDDELEAEEGEELARAEDAHAEAGREPAAGRSQKEIEQLTRKLEAEAERHAKRVRELMGEDFAFLVPNPTDWTPGFIFNVPEMLPAPDQVAALDAILGRESDDDFLDADDAEACDKCNARGQTKTGSRVAGQKTKPCGKCNGTGWVSRMLPIAPPVPYVQYQSPPNGVPMSPETYQVKDSWGRSVGHPHFGLEPASVGV
jgi:hypothetical protein